MAQTTEKFIILRRPEDGMFFQGVNSEKARRNGKDGLGRAFAEMLEAFAKS